MNIGIDGPAGSGKTTVAKLLAKDLGISYLDTGATYRALTVKVLDQGLDLADEDSLARAADDLSLQIKKDKVYLDGQDISERIRAPIIDKNISSIVAYPKVREIMRKLQREIASKGDFVIEGRDITTVVFPDAEFKFYLDADPKIRARRRYKELVAKGIGVDSEEVANDLEKRDYADKNRKAGPLVISDKAVYIDTTNFDIQLTVAELKKYIKF